jgi:hypothetical protein
MQRLSGFARIGAKRGSTRPAGVPVYLCARGGAVYADSSTCPARSHRTMEIRGSFAELVLQSLDLGERPDAEPMQLFVEDLALVKCSTPAILCNETQRPAVGILPLERYRYVLMLHQVQQVLAQGCEGGPAAWTPDEACRAVMYFSENDRFAPRGERGPGYRFVWKVGHKRGDA